LPALPAGKVKAGVHEGTCGDPGFTGVSAEFANGIWLWFSDYLM